MASLMGSHNYEGSQEVHRGYIKQWRRELDSRAFNDPDPFVYKLWQWCKLSAAWEERWNRGRSLQPGQFTCGRSEAAMRLNVSESKWYRAMQKLQEWGQITIEPNNRFTTVTICNWETYQSCEVAERTTSEQLANNWRTTDEQPANTLKEVQEVKELQEVEEGTPRSPPGGNSRASARKPVTVDDLTFPECLDNEVARKSVCEWLAYKRTRGQSYKTATGMQKSLAHFEQFGANATEFMSRAIDSAIINNWAGFTFKDTKHGKAKPERNVAGQVYDPNRRLGEI